MTAIDPAAASLNVARSKPGADRVRWIVGGAGDAPRIGADLAVMTGNVAQVFVDDDQWAETLTAAHDALRPGGWLVFDTRDAAKRAWERWTSEHTRQTFDLPGTARFTTWTDVVDVRPPLVSFRLTYQFDDGTEVISPSTLRFRSRDELASSLEAAGLSLVEVRDAPDRPGFEWIFLARR